jgi:hypothetical protein
VPALDAESRLALAADEPEVLQFLGEVGGRLTCRATAGASADDAADSAGGRADDAVRVLELHPASAKSETYWVRLQWTRYPYDPPSLTFLDGADGVPGRVSAWPVIAGYRAPNDICMPFCAEGFVTHPEWRTGPHAWVADGNPYLRTVMQLQDDLDYRYQGRAA